MDYEPFAVLNDIDSRKGVRRGISLALRHLYLKTVLYSDVYPIHRMAAGTMIGEVFERKLRLSMEEIAAFAETVGDLNPIHHDIEHARASRFGNIVASEPQISSLFMAMIATYFSQNRAVLGLEFNFRFIAPIFPLVDFKMRWEVIDVETKPSSQTELVTLEGRITNSHGDTLVEGEGKAMLMDSL